MKDYQIFCYFGYFFVNVLTFVCFAGLFFKLGECHKELEKKFVEFMTTHKRNYTTLEERNERFDLFAKNLQFHKDEETRHHGLGLGVTQFSDWKESEIRQLIPKQTHEKRGSFMKINLNVVSRPESVDWRAMNKVTSVTNQGICGSCWAFSTVAAVESAIAIKRGTLLDLSQQEILDCNDHDFGCRGGYLPYTMKFVKENGLCTNVKYPYKGVKGNKCLMNRNETRVFIDGYAMLDDENFMAAWIFKNGPVTFSMNITKPFLFYRSGIFNPKRTDCQEKSIGSHAMTIVGYGVSSEKKLYWIVKNSWGTHWGEKGYMRLARGVNSCGMAKTVVAPIVH